MDRDPLRLEASLTFDAGTFELSVDFENEVSASNRIMVTRANVYLPWFCGSDPVNTGILQLAKSGALRSAQDRHAVQGCGAQFDWHYGPIIGSHQSNARALGPSEISPWRAMRSASSTGTRRISISSVGSR